MKKNSIRAFTLTEMLIVIVIIGILIAALLPRMQAAQGRARDVARKTALSQIQSAIVVYQGDHGDWPKQKEGATGGMAVSEISKELTAAGMSSVPTDPLSSNSLKLGMSGSSVKDIQAGQYGYIVTKRNGVADGGFVLMAHTEVEGGSNWVYCGSTGNSLEDGLITGGTDIINIVPCEQLTQDTNSTGQCKSNSGNCTYKTSDQLRYIIVY